MQQPDLLLLVVGVVVVVLAARRLGLPSPILLVGFGVVAGALPIPPNISLQPDVVLTLFLPPLLYAAALNSSLIGLRANALPVALLAIGLPVATAFVVAGGLAVVVGGIPFAAALVLGATVGPPDAVAATAIARRVGLHHRLVLILEGESLLNDATALVLFVAARDAVTSGSISTPRVLLDVVVGGGGGVAIGWLVAELITRLRRHLDEDLVENTVSLLTPFAAYVPAERLHASGVLAVVVCGLILGHRSPTLLSASSRLQTQAVWGLVGFLLEGVVFALIGLQLPSIVRGLGDVAVGEIVAAAVVVSVAVVAVRAAWVLAAAAITDLFRGSGTTGGMRLRQAVVVSWSGMRGVISLALALSLPLTLDSGAAFPHRTLLIFITVVVILVTLGGQGLTLAPLIRRLGLPSDARELRVQEASARESAVRAGLRRLDAVRGATPLPDGVVDRLRAVADARRNAAWERISGDRGHDGSLETPSVAYRRLRREMLDAERTELVRLRDQGSLVDTVLDGVQRELDLEEAMLLRD